MIKHILFAATILISTGGFSNAQAQKKKNGPNTVKEVKFLEEITIESEPLPVTSSDPKAAFSKSLFTSNKKSETPVSNTASFSIEEANTLQFKYALLLDTEVEQVVSLDLLKTIDEWMGTRYRYGGSTKDGIDCSALMQTLYQSVYGITLPRTAREQYQFSEKISRTEIREGDLIFFNTIGGVSHVGMYLQNNKFLHASSGGGVMISDMYEDYWMRKFIGVGRIDGVQHTASISKP
jgi:murein DD-endopeptidase / murein LD-carboxypeptidase